MVKNTVSLYVEAWIAAFIPFAAVWGLLPADSVLSVSGAFSAPQTAVGEWIKKPVPARLTDGLALASRLHVTPVGFKPATF